MNGLFSEANLRNACQILFGSHIDPPVEFFSYLQPEGVKSAFRKRAFETHPDTNSSTHLINSSRNSEDFHRLTDAYKLLFSYVKQKPPLNTGREDTNVHCNSESGHFYYKGPLPHRRLEIGRYLYYRGLIPYQSIISAITWQRRQRPPVGRIARNLGLLSDDAVQLVLRTRKYTGLFGDKAISLGLLTKSQVSLLLSHQRSRQQKFGRYFIESGYFTERELERVVIEMRQHNSRIQIRS